MTSSEGRGVPDVLADSLRVCFTAECLENRLREAGYWIVSQEHINEAIACFAGPEYQDNIAPATAGTCGECKHWRNDLGTFYSDDYAEYTATCQKNIQIAGKVRIPGNFGCNQFEAREGGAS